MPPFSRSYPRVSRRYHNRVPLARRASLHSSEQQRDKRSRSMRYSRRQRLTGSPCGRAKFISCRYTFVLCQSFSPCFASRIDFASERSQIYTLSIPRKTSGRFASVVRGVRSSVCGPAPAALSLVLLSGAFAPDINGGRALERPYLR